MESVYRAAFIYIFLMIIIRISGNRTLNEMTVFDFVLLLIMGDASQQAITGSDYSIINAVIVITTLISLDIFFSFLKHKFYRIEHFIDGQPLILINNGRFENKNMNTVKIEVPDILESARLKHGIERIDQIKYAILEKDGDISIIPK